MSNPLQSIVLADREISSVLDAGDSFRLQRLTNLYHASHDKDAFVAALIAKLMLEHDRRALATHAMGRTL